MADRQLEIIGYRKACDVRGVGLAHYVMLTSRSTADDRSGVRPDRGRGYEYSR